MVDFTKMDDATLVAYGTNLLHITVRGEKDEPGLVAAGRLIGAGPTMIEYICELQTRFVKKAMTPEEAQRAIDIAKSVQQTL